MQTAYKGRWQAHMAETRELVQKQRASSRKRNTEPKVYDVLAEIKRLNTEQDVLIAKLEELIS